MEEEISGQTDLWLQEIESVDYWGPTFCAIYENGVQEDFMKKLEKRIEEHDAEIEKMCNHHYQGLCFFFFFFVKSRTLEKNPDSSFCHFICGLKFCEI